MYIILNLPNAKYFGNKIGIQFNSTLLVEEQKNYASRIVNVYIIMSWIIGQKIC